MPETGGWNVTRSEVSGSARDVVQARDVSGGIHFHQAEPAPGPVPRQLPPAIRDFTGRNADLAALDALLPADGGHPTGLHGHPGLPPGLTQPGAVVISAIDGTAGIGKTALAVYWAHRVRDRFPDGTLYVNLRGYGPGQPAGPGEVLEGFLRALGMPAGRIPAGVEAQAASYRSLLDGRRVLVVLDNAQNPEQVRPLLPASATCLALVTSRSSLQGLVILQGAARISLDLLPFDEAVTLLRGIVGATRADAEPEALGSIASACVRLPLALRIAGQRAAARHHLRLADIQAELADQRDRLDVLSASGDEMTMVRAVFAWSYLALPPGQQLVFRRLGLHPGTEISVHAAASLADVAPRRPVRIWRLWRRSTWSMRPAGTATACPTACLRPGTDGATGLPCRPGRRRTTPAGLLPALSSRRRPPSGRTNPDHPRRDSAATPPAGLHDRGGGAGLDSGRVPQSHRRRPVRREGRSA